MTDDRIRDCKLDPERLAPLRECADNYKVGDSDEDWPNNVLSTGTIAYSCGVLHRPGDLKPVHDHSASEMALCRRLATEAAKTMVGVAVGMGSASTSIFQPFFVVASRDTRVPAVIDDALIRRAFGGSIYPGAAIKFEPVAEGTGWWAAVRKSCGDYEDDLRTWRGMIAWFQGNRELHGVRFVSIGDSDDTDIRGCVFPRLVVGLSAAGSLVGICGIVVDA